jgi:hypothetical protein
MVLSSETVLGRVLRPALLILTASAGQLACVLIKRSPMPAVNTNLPLGRLLRR